jgi:hypothetical protein
MGKMTREKNVFFLQFHVPCLFNRKRYEHTAQINPLADGQDTPYRGECAMGNRGKIGKICMKLVAIQSLYHSDINYVFSTNVNITETTNCSSF